VKASELRDLRPQELDAKVTEMRNGLFNLRLKLRTGQLENFASVKKARRELARALTVQAQRRPN
jgi:large subunit ribosomal protein L29